MAHGGIVPQEMVAKFFLPESHARNTRRMARSLFLWQLNVPTIICSMPKNAGFYQL
jgi:hypothetical protein